MSEEIQAAIDEYESIGGTMYGDEDHRIATLLNFHNDHRKTILTALTKQLAVAKEECIVINKSDVPDDLKRVVERIQAAEKMMSHKLDVIERTAILVSNAMEGT